MTSTTSSDEILRVSGLTLTYRLRQYHSRSMREAFVRLAGNPLGSLFQPRETLTILQGLDLTLRKGDRLALIGINGSGKTSLCRSIAGMLKPDKGTIEIEGRCQAIFDAQVGIIPELTGRENVLLLAHLLHSGQGGVELKRIAAIAEEAMEFSELGIFLDTPWETYSAGMKARLCLSLMTAMPPDLLILDEVYDTTDQFFQKKMTDRLLDFIHQARAVIFVSHSPDLLKKICNRAIVLHEGRIAYDGSVDQALKAYDFLNGNLPTGDRPAQRASAHE
jgi:ABC-type polysaccharide/polyol phosphate transport system ATPase subunit